MARRILVLSLVLCLSSEGKGQPLFFTVETVDWMAVDSQVIVRAVVEDVKQEVDGSKQKWNTVVLTVRETLKGRHKPSHTYVIPDEVQGQDGLSRWKKSQQELLVFLADSKRPDAGIWWQKKAMKYALAPRGDTFLIELSARIRPQINGLRAVYTLDMRDPTDPKALLLYVRDAIAAAEKVRKPRKHTFRWPHGAENIDRIVPVDERLERQARRWIESNDQTWRTEGARALRYFKSEANVASLKKLLKDPTYTTVVRQVGERIIPLSREFEVRQAAFASLREMGVRVPKPVLSVPLLPRK